MGVRDAWKVGLFIKKTAVDAETDTNRYVLCEGERRVAV